LTHVFNCIIFLEVVTCASNEHSKDVKREIQMATIVYSTSMYIMISRERKSRINQGNKKTENPRKKRVVVGFCGHRIVNQSFTVSFSRWL